MQNPAYLRRPALVPGANLHSSYLSKLAPDLPTYRYKQRINVGNKQLNDFFDIIRFALSAPASSW